MIYLSFNHERNILDYFLTEPQKTIKDLTWRIAEDTVDEVMKRLKEMTRDSG
jgi:hypothetical protein